MQQLILSQGRTKSILNRHPWLFSGGVHQCKASEGEMVAVTKHNGELMGYGFYSTGSQIACRMFEWTLTEKPVETPAYWKAKLEEAIELRNKLIDQTNTNCFRLIHAEGDNFPGLIIDKYNDVLVIQPLTKGMEQLMPMISDLLLELGFPYQYLKVKQSSAQLERVSLSTGWLKEEHDILIEVVEHGIRFNIDVESGQKTGFFIDQRENRNIVKTYSKNKAVLNAFSYTGGFSLYALAGGAHRVHSVDISKQAIELANELVDLNFKNAPHTGVVADCFDYLGDMPDDFYDIIILDPPAFAKNKRAVANASRGYKQINLKAMRKIKKGGLLFTFSCSGNITKDLFQKIVFGAAADAHRHVRIVEQLHQPADHPINIYHPESEYLKGLLLYVE